LKNDSRLFLPHSVGAPSATMSIPDPREAPVNAVRVQTTIEADGELHLTELPCRRGDKVEAIVRILEQPFRAAHDAEREKARAAALHQFLALARSSSFRSASPYPHARRTS